MSVEKQPRWLVFVEALVSITVIGELDFVTGWEWSFFIFYAFPIALVVRKMGRRYGFLFAVICAGVWSAANFRVSPYYTNWAFALNAASRLFYFAVLVVAVAVAKKQAETDLARIKALEEAQELKQEILRTSEEEKRRIGQDLHDGLGPHLAAIRYSAVFLANELQGRGASETARAEELSVMAVKAISLTRDLARGIFPVQMDRNGLAVALEDLAKSTARVTGLAVTFAEAGKTELEDPEVAMHLFRIAQEAVNNALKHGAAKSVKIALDGLQSSLRLSITDDGPGMAPIKGRTQGVGLRSMQYRADAVGAVFQVKSRETGTIVSCKLPENPMPKSTHHLA